MPDIIEVNADTKTPAEKKQNKVIFKTDLVIWYILGLVEILLGFRFALRLFAANSGSGFVQFIYALSAPLMLPFQGIFKTPAESGYVLDTATVVAMFVYLVVAYLISELLHLVKPVSSEEVDREMEDK